MVGVLVGNKINEIVEASINFEPKNKQGMHYGKGNSSELIANIVENFK